ncbi:MAG: FHA domain-containing protein [Deltaproteobacteria bacterium]|nr:FHA domain-containing protein [Deltaproteobacteria bacterium]
MTTGRRAADRRRERESGDGAGALDDDGPGTTPGARPASPHDDYVEVDDEASRLDTSLLASADVVELDDESAHARSGSQPRRGAGHPPPASRGAALPTPQAAPRPGDDVVDAERSFARELKRRPRHDTAAQVKLEVTAIKERKARRVRRGGRLVVVAVDGAPPPAPVELSIAVDPALLGRAGDADLRLDDKAVSRRHAELSWRDPEGADDDDGDVGFFVVDLGSSSGTLRNGLPVEGRVRLDHGDMLGVGKTELRFLRADAAPMPRPEPEPTTASAPSAPEQTSTQVRVARRAAADAEREAQREARRRADAEAAALRERVRRRAGWVIAACAALGVVTVAGRLVHGAVLSDEAPAQVRLQVATLSAEAREHLLRGDIDGAALRVGSWLALVPDDAEGQSLDRVVRTEQRARDALQLALRMGDEDRDDEALEALLRIADSSVFGRDRDRLRGALAERALVRSLRIVEGLLDQGRVDEALARVEQHLARFPDDKTGQALIARVRAAKESAPKDPGLTPARAAFAAGRLDDARRLATAAGYAGYARDVERFERAFADGKASLSRYDGAAARGPLDDAFRLLGSLGASASSPIFASVQRPFADALYLSGTEKLEQGDGCGGARDLLKALRVLPDDPRWRGAQDQLAARAEQGLTLARGARPEDPERARTLARQALCFAPTGTKTWDELQALSR